MDACGRASAAGSRAADGRLAAELWGARWMVVGAEGSALHSRRTVPSETELREIIAMLAPLPPEP